MWWHRQVAIPTGLVLMMTAAVAFGRIEVHAWDSLDCSVGTSALHPVDAQAAPSASGYQLYLPIGLGYTRLGSRYTNCTARRAADLGIDGTVDQWRTIHYDWRGNLVSDEYDTNADGTVDYVFGWRYDTIGRLTSYFYDADVDGQADNQQRYYYDGQSRMIRVESYAEDLENPTSVIRYDYTSHGLVSKEQRDAHADGAVDEVHWYHYDARDRLIGVDQDLDNNGIIDASARLQWITEERRVVEEFDAGNDGNPEYYHEKVYDAIWRPILEEFRPADRRQVTERIIYEYEDDMLSKYTRFALDEIEAIVEYRYDGHGRLVGERHGGGSLDAVALVSVTYQCD